MNAFVDMRVFEDKLWKNDTKKKKKIVKNS